MQWSSAEWSMVVVMVRVKQKILDHFIRDELDTTVDAGADHVGFDSTAQRLQTCD
jgi:hypothetical protein